MVPPDAPTPSPSPFPSVRRPPRAALESWRSLLEAPERWASLPDDSKRRLGETLRDLFFSAKTPGDDLETLGRALLAVIRPEPVAQVDGLDVSFYPGGRFCKVRFVEEKHLPISLRRFFARPAAAGLASGATGGARPGASLALLAVFVDPREFSFRTFENLIPLDRYFERGAVEFTLKGGRPLVAGSGAWSFAVEAPEATRKALLGLDDLGLYVPPLDTTARGGQRFLFHAARLAEALTRALRGALGAALGGPGVFSHVNPVFRCNRFEPGDDRFHRHLDNPYSDRDRRHISRYTLLLYLTGGTGAPALRLGDDGSLTTLDAMTCVVFDQRIEHEGGPFLDGRKVFLRSELIFEVAELRDLPAAGELFARACYLTGESLFAPELSNHVQEHYRRAAEAHWQPRGQGGRQEHDRRTAEAHREGSTGATMLGDPYRSSGIDVPGEPFLHRSFRGVHYVANGHDFWFPRGALSLPACAAVTLLDFFNARVDGVPFRSLCQTEVVHAGEPGWIGELLAPHGGPLAEPVVAPLDREALLPPPPAADHDICCSYHTDHPHRIPEVIERYEEARAFARERLASAPIALMGQQILLDPARFVVEESRIHVLSERALSPVHFAACQNASIPPGILVGVGATLEALQPLVPPILFVESGGCVHLMFDFFRNGWAIDLGPRPAPIPALLEDLDEPHLWGASPWDAAEERLSGGGSPDELAGLCWWQGRPVVVSLDDREVDASDPTLDPGILEELLQSDDRRARVAAAANPNLPSDTLAGLLKPVFDSHDTYLERREEHVAAWQNPSTPVVMLLQPRDDYPEAARQVLLWLEHLHGVRLGSAHESLEPRVESWTLSLQAPPGRRHEHRIVRDFASYLGDIFRLAPPPSEDLFLDE